MVCWIGLCVWDRIFFSAYGLGKSVKSRIGFPSQCFYFVCCEFDAASLSACIYMTCSSSMPWVGGFV